ncbi:MAG: flagellar type III secretion system pore protein FliP [Myxococcales bacterium]|nr:flagellar type III secretion system pore protein FliP [Myxococcales bacterium]
MESVVENLGSASPLRVVVLLTLLTLVPGLILSMTAFLRIILVMGFLRNAIGLAQMPPNQILIGLSLFLTYFVMADHVDQSMREGVTPYMEGRLTELEAVERSLEPFRRFMLEQTRERDLALMANLAKVDAFEGPEDVPTRVLVPAFITSELRVAFAIGFLLFIPFLVIDLSTAAVLNALGMIMLPPTAISLPFKILVFVIADGWSLMVASLVRTFGA